MSNDTLLKIFNQKFKKNYNIKNRVIEIIKSCYQNINEYVKEWNINGNLFDYEIEYDNSSIPCIDKLKNQYRMYNEYIIKLTSTIDNLLNVFQNKKLYAIDLSILSYTSSSYIIRYIYDNIKEDVYNIFNISKEDYIIKFGKIYNRKEYSYVTQLVPYVLYHDIDKYWNISINKNGQYDQIKYICYLLYLYNVFFQRKDKLIINNNCINYNFLLGNITNNLTISIIDKKNKSNFIMRYDNNKNITCKNIKSFKSLYEVKRYNGQNIEKIASDEFISDFRKYHRLVQRDKVSDAIYCKIICINEIIWKKLKTLIYNEYKNNKIDSILVDKELHNINLFIMFISHNNNNKIPGTFFKIDNKNNICFIDKLHKLLSYLLTINVNMNYCIDIEDFMKLDYDEYIDKYKCMFDNDFNKIVSNDTLYYVDSIKDNKIIMNSNINELYKYPSTYIEKHISLNDYKYIYNKEFTKRCINKSSTLFNYIYKMIDVLLKDTISEIFNLDNYKNEMDLFKWHIKCYKDHLKESNSIKENHYNKLTFDNCISKEDINNKLLEINYYTNDELKLEYINIYRDSEK